MNVKIGSYMLMAELMMKVNYGSVDQ